MDAKDLGKDWPQLEPPKTQDEMLFDQAIEYAAWYQVKDNLLQAAFWAGKAMAYACTIRDRDGSYATEQPSDDALHGEALVNTTTAIMLKIRPL